MPSLTEAFRRMRDRGLVAVRNCYCEQCAEYMIPRAARRPFALSDEPRGFVHVGEWESSDGKSAAVPLHFGTVTGDQLDRLDPAALAVGRVVAACLDDEGIRYDWDRTPGSPILVAADASLSGLPAAAHHHAPILIDDDHRLFRSPTLPDAAFEGFGGNRVEILNLATVRRLGLDLELSRGAVPRPRVGETVKLGFRVRGSLAPDVREEMGALADRIQTEAMWVEVTSIDGYHPRQVFRGELMNVPTFIDPAVLRIGSPVEFTAEHIYPRETRARARRA
jgi:hypothetical protein